MSILFQLNETAFGNIGFFFSFLLIGNVEEFQIVPDSETEPLVLDSTLKRLNISTFLNLCLTVQIQTGSFCKCLRKTKLPFSYFK